METEAWTTSLGRQLLALENQKANYAAICILEDDLKSAFNTLKHIRRCYAKRSHDHLSQN